MVALHTRHPLPRPINGVYQRDGRARDVGERPAPQPRQGWISGGSHFQFVTAIAQSDRLAFPTVGGFGRAFYGTDLCSGPCATPQPQAEVSVIFRVFRPSHVQNACLGPQGQTAIDQAYQSPRLRRSKFGCLLRSSNFESSRTACGECG